MAAFVCARLDKTFCVQSGSLVGRNAYISNSFCARTSLLSCRNCQVVQTDSVTFNIARNLHQRLHALAFSNRLSRSSIVEIAIRQFFEGRSDEDIVAELLSHGASLRRRES